MTENAQERETEREPHPMQPLEWDGDVIRFRANQIVRFLLDAGPFDLNQLAIMRWDDDDWNQFAQLIGYSVSGFGGLSYANPEHVARADDKAQAMLGARPGRRGQAAR